MIYQQAAYVTLGSERISEDLNWITKEIIESFGEALLLNGELLVDTMQVTVFLTE